MASVRIVLLSKTFVFMIYNFYFRFLSYSPKLILGLFGLMLCSSELHAQQFSFSDVHPDTCYHINHQYDTRVFSRFGKMSNGRLDANSLPAPTSTFEVSYNNAFPQEARKAFEYATYLLSTVLVSDIPIKINANMSAMGSGILASAGTTRNFKNFAPSALPDVEYPSALADAMAGRDLSPGMDDITIEFNSQMGWYYGTDLNAGSKVDFVTIAIHELFHGLGFSARAMYSANSGAGFISESPLKSLMVNLQGVMISNMANYTKELGDEMVSDAIYLKSEEAAEANGGKKAKIHAPATFRSGSSISHLDERTYRPGNPNSLMSPSFGRGEAVHDISPMIRGILKEMGWQINEAKKPVANMPDQKPEPKPEPVPEPIEKPEPVIEGLAPVALNDPQPGILYAYYEGNWSALPDFSSLNVLQSGTLAEISLSPRSRDQEFAFSYSGYFNAPSDGSYTFFTTSDDGSKLYIHDQLVVDNDGLHGPQERNGKISLKKGMHPIRVEFFEKSGGETLMVHVQLAGQDKRSLAAADLFYENDGKSEPGTEPIEDGLAPVSLNDPHPGIRYAYYHGQWSVLPDFDQHMALKTGSLSEISLSPRERDHDFGFSFTGYFNAPVDGSYTFFTTSDDGSKLYLHDQMVVDNDGLHASREKKGEVVLKKGMHPIRVEFFERGGFETLLVHVQLAGHEKRSIAGSDLFYDAQQVEQSQDQGLAGISMDNPIQGVKFDYFEGSGWQQLPAFASLEPVKSGTLSQFSLAPRQRDADFGFVFHAYFKASKGGEYTFFTTSDDGSKLYIHDQLVVDNDGLHAKLTKSGSVFLQQGYHPIRVEFFERGGQEVLEVGVQLQDYAPRKISRSELFYEDVPEAASFIQTDFTDVVLFPNPAEDIVRLEFNAPENLAEVWVHNQMGTLVRYLPGLASGQEINLSDQPAGLYMVKVKSGEAYRYFKLLLNE